MSLDDASMSFMPVWPPLSTSVSLLPSEILVVAVDLRISDPRLAQYQGWLSPDEQQRAARCHQQRHQRRFVAAHGALRDILARIVGCQPSALTFTTSTHGKPALVPVSAAPAPRFSLTHSGDMALVALATDRDIGVDIEQHRPGVAMTALARRFFSPDEADSIARLSPAEQTSVFFNCWSRKEAVVKALGTGLLTPLHQFSVNLETSLPLGPIRAPQGWPLLSLMSVALPSGWSGALAMHGDGGAIAYFVAQ